MGIEASSTGYQPTPPTAQRKAQPASYENPKMFPILSSQSSCNKCGIGLGYNTSSSVVGLCSSCSKKGKLPVKTCSHCGIGIGNSTLKKCGSCASKVHNNGFFGACGSCKKSNCNKGGSCASKGHNSDFFGSPCKKDGGYNPGFFGAGASCNKKPDGDKHEKCEWAGDLIRDDDWTPRCNHRPKVSKKVKDKKLVVVNGPRSVGKTTLIKVLLGFDKKNTTITYNSDNPPSTHNWVIIDTNTSFCEVIARARSWLLSSPEGSRCFVEYNADLKSIKNKFKNATVYHTDNAILINLSKPPYAKSKGKVICA